MIDTFTRDRGAWLDMLASSPDVDATAFRVAYVISGLVNRKTGDAWPGIDHLARAIGANERTVRRSIDSLVTLGFLAKKRGGDGRPNRYRIAFTDRTPMSDQIESSPDTDVQSEESRSDTHVRIDEKQTGHLCHSDRTFGAFQTGHPCPPISLRDLSDDLPEKNILVERAPKSPFDAEFEDLWKIYPQKVSKGRALKAFKAARKIADLATISAGVTRYAAERAGADPKYTRHLATWLNDRCWEDEAAPPPSPTYAPPASHQGGKNHTLAVLQHIRLKGIADE